jgi:hypothetical protein
MFFESLSLAIKGIIATIPEASTPLEIKPPSEEVGRKYHVRNSEDF